MAAPNCRVGVRIMAYAGVGGAAAAAAAGTAALVGRVVEPPGADVGAGAGSAREPGLRARTDTGRGAGAVLWRALECVHVSQGSG